MSDFDTIKAEIIEKLSNLTVLQMAELVKDLEDQWGVSAQAAVAVAAPAAAAVAEVEEQTEFDCVLTSFGEKKIQVIKEVRALTGLGLKEAKEMVENVPNTIKEGVPKEEAEKVKAKVEDAGGVVEIK